MAQPDCRYDRAFLFGFSALGALLLSVIFFQTWEPPPAQAQAGPQTAPVAAVPAGTVTSDSAFVEYEKEVAAENKDHEDFIEHMDEKLEDDALKLGGAGITVLGALGVWLGFTTKKDTQETIDAALGKAEKEVNKKVGELKGQIKNNLDVAKTDFDKQIAVELKEIRDKLRERLLNTIAEQSEILGLQAESLVALAIVLRGNLSVPERTKEANLVASLDEALGRYPGNRELAVQRARHFVEADKNLTGGIQFIEKILQSRQQIHAKEKTPLDEDDAALLYNLGCYEACQWKEIKDKTGDTEIARASALQDRVNHHVKQAIDIDEAIRDEANDDSELKAYIEVLGRF